jgi:vacuolar-type H+-ATPase subunit H
MKNKVDQINDAFIQVLGKENSKQYEKYLKDINREMIANIDKLTPDKVKSIIKGAEINIDDIALLFLIQNAVLMIIDKKVPRKKLDVSLLPILAIVGMYSLKRPKRFVEKIVKINKGVKLGTKEKEAQAIIEGFKRDNAKILTSARKIARTQLDLSQLKSKTSRRMVRDMNKMLEEKKSIDTIQKSLVRRYNKLSNVERMLDTELHAQSEFIRKEHSKAIGMTHKIWHTQGDSRVRETKFHNGVADKKVPIDSDFRAGGLRAEQPGDTRLPPSDRIRCRCYLTYE